MTRRDAQSREADRIRPLSAGHRRLADRSSRTACRSSAPTRRTARIAANRVFLGTDALSAEPRFPARLRGHVPQPVPREPPLRKVVVAAARRPDGRLSYSLRTRVRHPQLRRHRPASSRPRTFEPRRFLAWPLGAGRQSPRSTKHSHLPAIQLESRAGEHRLTSGRTTSDVHAHRRPRHDAGLRSDARLAARRLHAVMPSGAAPIRSRRASFSASSTTRSEVPERQSAVRAAPGRDLHVPVPGALRLRQSRPEHRQSQFGFFVQDDWNGRIAADVQRRRCGGTTSPTC